MAPVINLAPVRARLSPKDYVKYLEDRLARTVTMNIELSSKNERLSDSLKELDVDAYAEVLG